MSRKSINLPAGKALFEEFLCCAERFPVSFTLGGIRYRGLGSLEPVSCERTATDTGERASIVRKTADGLVVRTEALYNAEYGQSEYTVYFENTAQVPSAPLTDVCALMHTFSGDNPLLRGILGDRPNCYTPYETDLSLRDARMESLIGRTTHECFPYFNLVHGDGGTLIALGWAGTWDAMFTKTTSGTLARLRSVPALKACLTPGETIETGLVVLLPYSGRSDDDAMNLWREWFVNCNMPRADASGAPITPFSTTWYANDTGLPNSDGSISERYFTWQPSLEKVVAENIVPDFRWFDAGWYFDPAGQTVETDWWGTVGTWELDKVKWPGASFRESVEAFHKHGAKTLVWFEPERVTHVDDLVRNYGYKKEWAIDAGGSITNNIGDPECLKWTLNRIISMLDENLVDLYREDNNANHNQTWRKLDDQYTAELGAPRYGISEVHSIVGHYRLWDGILDYCAKNGRCTFVDSCAGGGGRNDIASLRRGVPFMRSDADRTTTALRLSMSASFNRWIPFHGANTKETEGELDASTGAGSDGYVYRASYLPVFNYGEAFTHNPDLDFDMMRRFIAEWKSIRHLLVKDMYVLTPWHARDDRLGWTAFAYDDPDAGESLLLAFRMEDSADSACTVKLPFAAEGAVYTLTDADTGNEITLDGAALRSGLELTLNAPRSCLMYRIRRA